MSEMFFPDDVPDEEVSKAPPGYYTDLHVIELTPLDIDLIATAMGVMTGYIAVDLNPKGVENFQRVMLRFLDEVERIRPSAAKDA